MRDRSFAIEFDHDAVEEFCRKWRIKEFALFGSVLTDEFNADSDVDVLISFEEAKPDLGPWGEHGKRCAKSSKPFSGEGWIWSRKSSFGIRSGVTTS